MATEENPQDNTTPQNAEKDPDDWATGEEAATGPQISYIQTLAREAQRDVDVSQLNKADASKLIEELQSESGRG